ncbi:hypothetical protein M3B51_09275 [Kocuria carniphila]|uniref:hypothetical protein n=1 Tax=Kocuria carniphila TaxID=262208 RepID=UPI0021A645FA|nr:hypothetical protein [Kocuria carniphila]MCT1802973.1 hypothetical protein [Kocuria carniphila]
MTPTPATSSTNSGEAPESNDQWSASPQMHPDEVHVLIAGLDPVTATAALLLADAGVCLINVTDPGSVTSQDTATGPYPPALEGSPREYALRKLLRNRWPRCVPLSAPELFCSSVIPSAAMLRSASVTGPLPQDLTVVDLAASPDAHLPTITVVTDGSVSLTWPLVPWYRRPCRECIVNAVRDARKVLRDQPPLDPDAVATAHSLALTTLTRVITASGIAVDLLGQSLNPQNTNVQNTWDAESPGTITLRYGLHRSTLTPRADCLCALDG